MPFDFACPDCKANLKAPDGASGRMIVCPHCKRQIQIPAIAPVASVPAPIASLPEVPIAPPEIAAPPIAGPLASTVEGPVSPLSFLGSSSSGRPTAVRPKEPSSIGSYIIYGILALGIAAAAGVYAWMNDWILVGGPEVTWHTASKIEISPFETYSLNDEAKKLGMVIVIVDLKVRSAHIPNQLQSGGKYKWTIDSDWIKLITSRNETITGDGNKAISPFFQKGRSVMNFEGESAPDKLLLGAFFAVRQSEVDSGNLRFQYRDFSPTLLSAANRRQPKE